AKPGRSLGRNERRVLSQAHHFDPAHPTDAQFVENVMWEESHVVFVTVNLPGSNKDAFPWSGICAEPTAQAQEVAERTAADLRWLQAAFGRAESEYARAVVIGLQA